SRTSPGCDTAEGSRTAMAGLVHAGLHLIARSGYELLIDQGIEKARTFADIILAAEDFELITDPELNILTYRYVPTFARRLLDSDNPLRDEANELLNGITKAIQKTQRGRGRSFVSRTRLTPQRYDRQAIVVFRVVLANPLTTIGILEGILTEQREIASRAPVDRGMEQLRRLTEAQHAD